jgi:hypothetical protein
LIEEELDTQEIELTRLVEHKKSLKVHSTYFQFVLTAMISFNYSEVFNLQRNVDTEKNTCMVINREALRRRIFSSSCNRVKSNKLNKSLGILNNLANLHLNMFVVSFNLTMLTDVFKKLKESK